MKLSSISCTVITLAALTCSVTAIPTHYSPSHHDEVPPASGQPQGTGAYRRDLEDDNLFARGQHDHQHPHDQHPHDHHQSHNQQYQTQGHGGGSVRRRDLEDDNLFARATHHTGGQGYNNLDALRRRDLVEDRRLFARSTHLTAAHAEPLDRRDLEDDEDLFARHEHHGQEHNDPSGPVLQRRRLVARSTQYNNYD